MYPTLAQPGDEMDRAESRQAASWYTAGMLIPRAIALSLPVLVLMGCAEHGGAVHVAPDESKPHVSWEIRTGGQGGERELTCGSDKPSVPCELSAALPDRPSAATVHLYLHAAAEMTSYLGVLSVPFLEGQRPADREVSITVPPGSQPVGVTISAAVVSKPGSYRLGIRLDASQGSVGASSRIVEDIPVTVK